MAGHPYACPHCPAVIRPSDGLRISAPGQARTRGGGVEKCGALTRRGRLPSPPRTPLKVKVKTSPHRNLPSAEPGTDRETRQDTVVTGCGLHHRWEPKYGYARTREVIHRP